MANKNMKRCSILEKCKSKLQWDTYHLTPVRMPIIKKSTHNKCWRGCGEKGTLLHCWWKFILIQTPWRTVWRFLKKLGIKFPYEIPLRGKYPEETRTERAHVTQCSLQRYLQQPRHGNNLTGHQGMGEWEGVEKREPSCTVGGNAN